MSHQEQSVSSCATNPVSGASLASCVTAAIATAWGGGAAGAGNVDVSFSISPTVDLTEGLLVHSVGFSELRWESVGAITAGTTASFSREIRIEGVGFYTFLGLYEDATGAAGAVVAFPGAAVPGVLGETFESIFADPNDAFADITEAALVADLETGIDLFGEFFYRNMFYSPSAPFDLRLGQSGTLVKFSEGTLAGSIDAIPAPATAAAGLVVALSTVRRRR